MDSGVALPGVSHISSGITVLERQLQDPQRQHPERGRGAVLLRTLLDIL